MLGKDASILVATFITVAKRGGSDGEGGCSGGVETYSGEGGGKQMGFPKKMRDLMYTCKLMTAEGINLALENWRGVHRVDKSSGRLSVLPVVIDICGVPCGQKEVHKEDDRCAVRRGSVSVCKTEDSSEAQTGQKQQERRMTLERAAARRVRAWSLMTSTNWRSYCCILLRHESPHELNGELAELDILEKMGWRSSRLLNVVTIRQK